MKSTSTFLIIIATIAILWVFIHAESINNVNLDGGIKVNDGKLNGQSEHNMSEIMIVVYLPDESGEITGKNLIKASEVTNLSIEDLKNAKYLSICHNEKQCMEMERKLTGIIEEIEENPYGVPKPIGNAFGIKIINKTKEHETD